MPTRPAIVRREHLDDLFRALTADGFALVGPTVRDGAIVYDRIESAASLPEGWTEVQEPGRYRLERRHDRALFGYAVGPHSWKEYFHLPRLRLFAARRRGDSVEVDAAREPAPKLALIGVRSCEIHAIAIQDRVLAGGAFADPSYVERRRDAFIVAVNCGVAGGTCFCASMNTGPRVEAGHDLALTELGGGAVFLVEVGSERGRSVLERVRREEASEDDVARARAVVAETARHMGRTMETRGIRDLLVQNPEHPRWEEVAQRCLACANCTMVCPTCFCSTVEDTSDLTGDHAERWRRWDSCFNLDFSYVHGGSVRTSVKGRYRQWLTHKLATWFDQFGSSGCVGCGRCITWCPVGIDITEEVGALRLARGERKP